MRPPVTALFMVKDEADRLPAALASVAWADEVVVADTGSLDGTPDVARSVDPRARVVDIPWEGYVATRNRALAAAATDWILFLDADERVTPELAAEIEGALSAADTETAGISTPRLAHWFGRPVRHGTWYPDRKLRLGRRSRGFRVEGGRVHETLTVDGRTVALVEPLLHFPYRDLSDALRKHMVYARLKAQDRFDAGRRGSVPSLLFRPPLEFLRSYVLKAGFLDGAAGAGTALLHAASYMLVEAFLWEAERRASHPEGANDEG